MIVEQAVMPDALAYDQEDRSIEKRLARDEHLPGTNGDIRYFSISSDTSVH
jgi:hypothetical protein